MLNKDSVMTTDGRVSTESVLLENSFNSIKFQRYALMVSVASMIMLTIKTFRKN